MAASGESAPSGATLGELLRVPGLPALEARMLAQHVLGLGAAHLIAHPEQVVAPDALARLREAQRRRLDGEPLAYITGAREFHGLALRVSPAVLIPRPETELLVEWAQACFASRPAALPPTVVDMGTGSGAIALALKHRLPAAAMTATDASSAALDVARGNAAALGLAVDFRHGDWWQAVSGRRFGLAVTNPPYVAGDDSHLQALGHEPRGALTPEGDGLRALRDIVRGAPLHLLPGGWLLLEHGHDQQQAVQALLAEAGFEQIQTRQDLAGLPRCSGGRRPGSDVVMDTL